jgi:hypothetical protein
LRTVIYLFGNIFFHTRRIRTVARICWEHKQQGRQAGQVRQMFFWYGRLWMSRRPWQYRPLIFPPEFAQFAKQCKVVHKIYTKLFRYTEYPMPVRDFFQNVGQKPLAIFDHFFLVAGRTKMPEDIVPAMVASNPRKAAMQVPTIQVFVNHIHNNGVPKPINRCIAFIPNALNLFKMILLLAPAVVGDLVDPQGLHTTSGTFLPSP